MKIVLFDGAKTLDVDPDVNVLSLEPVAKIPESAKPAAKTQEEEMRALQQAKDAYMEKLINN